MSGAVTVLSVGPGVTLQDTGRPGYLAQGLSVGGAADRVALAEGAALLRQPVGAALELAGFGGRFTANCDLRIALTGAPMAATLDGAPLVWSASHAWPAGSVLDIGAVLQGVYGYLTIGGGLDVPHIMGAQSAHLNAGLGQSLAAGDTVPVLPDNGDVTGQTLATSSRWDGGTLRVLPSLQTRLFDAATRDRFTQEPFARDPRGNRMGIRLQPSGEGFALSSGQSILSEVISPGDIQIPGDGSPYILLYECQTTGGYPRIGTVIPADLPKVAQTPPGAALRFRFVDRAEALAAEVKARAELAGLPRQVQPLLRDPRQMTDLLSYTLISGVTDGKDLG